MQILGKEGEEGSRLQNTLIRFRSESVMSFCALRIKQHQNRGERTGDVMERMTSGLISRRGRLVRDCGRS